MAEDGVASSHTCRDGERIVFLVRRATECGRCGEALESGAMIALEAEAASCLSCAGLNDLAYLPRGDAALTRRANKYSQRSAVVVQWRRARNRYERQGILAEAAAIERARAECESDEPQRSRQRRQRRKRDERIDQEHVAAFAARIRELYPCCPSETVQRIAEHACRRSSGRVGRSAAARELDGRAVRLAVAAFARRHHTRYDALLARGQDRREARELAREALERVLRRWQAEA